MRLNDSYMQLSSNILSRDPLLDAKGAYVLIISKESHRVVVTGSGDGSSQRTQSSMFNSSVNNRGSAQSPTINHIEDDVEHPQGFNGFNNENEMAATSEHDFALSKADNLSDRKAIWSKWIFKIKYKSDGDIERYKARLVAKGYNQKERVNFDDTFSPVMKIVTVSPNDKRVCKLKKSLYGLKQAPKHWNTKLTQALIDNGFSQSKSGYSLFTKSNDHGFLVLLVYVDDIIITRSNVLEIEKFKDFLKSRKDCLDLLSDFGLLACKPSVVSLEQNTSITSEPSESNLVIDNKTEYQKLIGKSLEFGSIRRIQGIGYGVLEFLGVGTTHGYAVSSLMDTAYWDFAKSVKAISLPQDVLSTSDRRLIELENQVQCLMEAHLALTQPTQVNKIITSCKICSGPHETQYCMEDLEQAFFDYASSQTNETGSRQFTMNQGLRNFNKSANTYKGKPNFNWAHAETFTNPQNDSFSNYSSSYQTKREKALIDFDSHQEKRLSSLRTQFGQQPDDMICKINLLWKAVSEKLDDAPILDTAGNPAAQMNFTSTNDPTRE
uniref:Ribonuclease H-like domain-containing protein n=1 Tax=Tanacetum cinerariifolium TaxID=118510 RepID=A0A6L2MXQ0_TANCI|nr:ribonuclease H-like domain-containing protein [Tanacetum cinerariifolium]